MNKENIFRIIVFGITTFVIGIILAINITTSAADIPSSQVTYTNNSQSTVDGAIDDLFSRVTNPSGCTTPPFSIGSYISMIPTLKSYKVSSALTGYSLNQSIKSSELTL